MIGFRAKSFAALKVAALAAAVALPAVSNGWTIDDSYLVVANPAVHSLGNLPSFFSEPWGNGAGGQVNTRINASYFRPVATTLHAIEYAVFGPRPWGFHLVSLLLHAAAAALVFTLVRRVTASCAAAALGGALFAVMPVHSEVIAAVTYQTTLLATVLGLGALVVLGRVLDAAGRARPPDLAALLCLPAAAVLAKEEAAPVPLLAAAWVLLARPAGWRRSLAVGCGAITAAVAAALAWRAALVVPTGVDYFTGASPGTVLRSMLATVQLYGELLLAPVRLCPFYDWFILPPAEQMTAATWLGAAIALALLAGTIAAARRAPSVAVGLAWLAIGVLPVMHVLPMLNVAAERFLYLPSAGFCLAVGALCGPRLPHPGAPRRAASLALVLGVLGGYGLRTAVRLPEWRDDSTLNQATARDFPETPTPLLNLAGIAEKAGDVPAARRYLEEAASRAPGWDVPLRRIERLRASRPSPP